MKEQRKVVFIKNEKALKYFSGVYPDNEMLTSCNCTFIEEKIEEGYKPLCYDFMAGGFYFLEPEPIHSYNLIEEYCVNGRGVIYIVKDTDRELSINQIITINGRKFKINSVEKQDGRYEVGLIGKFLD